MQTKDDGKHDILPVARSRDHAGMPVTLPRESDGKMRRDGSDAAHGQPQHPVAERGGVHGAPELSPRMVERIADKISVVCSIRKEGRRWRKQRPNNGQLGVEDKRNDSESVPNRGPP